MYDDFYFGYLLGWVEGVTSSEAICSSLASLTIRNSETKSSETKSIDSIIPLHLRDGQVS